MHLTLTMKELIVSFSEATLLSSTEKSSVRYICLTEQSKEHKAET